MFLPHWEVRLKELCESLTKQLEIARRELNQTFLVRELDILALIKGEKLIVLSQRLESLGKELLLG